MVARDSKKIVKAWNVRILMLLIWLCRIAVSNIHVYMGENLTHSSGSPVMVDFWESLQSMAQPLDDKQKETSWELEIGPNFPLDKDKNTNINSTQRQNLLSKISVKETVWKLKRKPNQPKVGLLFSLSWQFSYYQQAQLPSLVCQNWQEMNLAYGLHGHVYFSISTEMTLRATKNQGSQMKPGRMHMTCSFWTLQDCLQQPACELSGNVMKDMI